MFVEKLIVIGFCIAAALLFLVIGVPAIMTLAQMSGWLS
jgi:hypothetical protein